MQYRSAYDAESVSARAEGAIAVDPGGVHRDPAFAGCVAPVPKHAPPEQSRWRQADVSRRNHG